MKKLRESFLKKYGFAEYVLFIIGVAISGRATYSIIVLNFKDTSWTELAFITTAFLLGVLAFAAPKALVDLAKRKSKNDKPLNDDETK